MKKMKLLSKYLFKWIIIFCVFSGSIVGLVYWKGMHNAYIANINAGTTKSEFFDWLWSHGWSNGPTLIVVSCMSMILISLYIIFELIRFILTFLQKYKIIKKENEPSIN